VKNFFAFFKEPEHQFLYHHLHNELLLNLIDQARFHNHTTLLRYSAGARKNGHIQYGNVTVHQIFSWNERLEVSSFSLHDMRLALAGAIIVGTLVATVDGISQYDPMSGELASAMTTARRQGTHGTLKAIKDMPVPAQTDFKALAIVIPTDFASGIPLYFSNSTHKCPRYLIPNKSEPEGKFSSGSPWVKLFTSSSPRLLDILTARLLLGVRWLGTLRYISTRLCLEKVAALMDWFRAELLDHIPGFACIPDKAIAADVRVLLADQPLDRRPGAAFALARHPLDVTGVADILRAETDKIRARADLHVVIISLTRTARFLSFCFFTASCHGLSPFELRLVIHGPLATLLAAMKNLWNSHPHVI
jgi:hypothetical protein